MGTEQKNEAIALRTALHAERENNASLHRLLLNIREAAGDQHGRLMQGELVEHIRATREKSQCRGELREDRAAATARRDARIKAEALESCAAELARCGYDSAAQVARIKAMQRRQAEGGSDGVA